MISVEPVPRRTGRVLSVCLALLGAVCAAAAEDGKTLKRVATEKPLGQYDVSKYDAKKPTLWVSPDGRHAAYLTEKGIVIDGKAKEYDFFVDPQTFAFSPDSQRTAYAARVKRPNSDTNFILVLDGQEATQAYHHIGPGPVFSPDSKHVAFFADRYVKEGEDDFVVIDGKEGEPQHNLGGEMAFTPDSKRLIYAVAIPGRKTNSTIREQTIDGSQKPNDRAHGPWMTSGNFFFGPGGQVGYIGYAGEKQFLVVYDGKEDPSRHDELLIRNIVVNADGKHVAYIGAPSQTTTVVTLDGKPGKIYDWFKGGEIIDRTLAISPDGSRVGYAVKGRNAIFLVVDGKEGKGYGSVSGPTFSPDSRRVAYQARTGKKFLMVVDDREGPPFDELGLPEFSPDSKTVAYWARAGKEEFMLINGQRQKAYESVGTPIFSPDGKRMVYPALAGDKWQLVGGGVAGGTEQQGYHDMDGQPVFSADGRHLAAVCDVEGQQMVVVDGVAGNRYDKIVRVDGGALHFGAEKRDDSSGDLAIHYLATQGDKLLLVEETLKN